MENNQNGNSYEQQKSRGLKRKWDAIQQFGGKCQNCGYNKNIASLEFHHINPKEKSFQIDMRAFSNTKLDTLQEELNKCTLLCANCHRELHNSELSFENIPFLVDSINKLSFNNLSGSICPICGTRFPKSKGKIYCSKECRMKDKNYPSLDLINEQYEILKSWDKVAKYFGLTRKILQGIRKL